MASPVSELHMWSHSSGQPLNDTNGFMAPLPQLVDRILLRGGWWQADDIHSSNDVCIMVAWVGMVSTSVHLDIKRRLTWLTCIASSYRSTSSLVMRQPEDLPNRSSCCAAPPQI
jgi:hypothetical protein